MDEKANAKKSTTGEVKPEPIMHDLQPVRKNSLMKIVVILVVVGLLGVGTGFALAQTGAGDNILSEVPGAGSSVQKGKTYGSTDTKTFKDTAEGTLREGGIEGEGQFHLERPGGKSQDVYMTSSLVDLSEFKGKKIKVWGETQKAQHAGWLMDVGRVQVL